MKIYVLLILLSASLCLDRYIGKHLCLPVNQKTMHNALSSRTGKKVKTRNAHTGEGLFFDYF